MSTMKGREATSFGPRRGSHLVEVELQSLDNSCRYKNRGATFTWHIFNIIIEVIFNVKTCSKPVLFANKILIEDLSTGRNKNLQIWSPTILTAFDYRLNINLSKALVAFGKLYIKILLVIFSGIH